MKEITFYVSFSQKYRNEPHPEVAWAHPDGWLRVTVPLIEQHFAVSNNYHFAFKEAELEAYKRISMLVDQHWSCMYTEADLDESYKFTLVGQHQSAVCIADSLDEVYKSTRTWRGELASLAIDGALTVNKQFQPTWKRFRNAYSLEKGDEMIDYKTIYDENYYQSTEPTLGIGDPNHIRALAAVVEAAQSGVVQNAAAEMLTLLNAYTKAEERRQVAVLFRGSKFNATVEYTSATNASIKAYHALLDAILALKEIPA